MMKFFRMDDANRARSARILPLIYFLMGVFLSAGILALIMGDYREVLNASVLFIVFSGLVISIRKAKKKIEEKKI